MSALGEAGAKSWWQSLSLSDDAGLLQVVAALTVSLSLSDEAGDGAVTVVVARAPQPWNQVIHAGRQHRANDTAAVQIPI